MHVVIKSTITQRSFVTDIYIFIYLEIYLFLKEIMGKGQNRRTVILNFRKKKEKKRKGKEI